MAKTGLSDDGFDVFNDIQDSVGRRVTRVATMITRGQLEGGVGYKKTLVEDDPADLIVQFQNAFNALMEFQPAGFGLVPVKKKKKKQGK